MTAGNVDINRGLFPAATGSQTLDLVGNTLGTIRQTSNTTVGQTYTLTFLYANNPCDAFSAAAPAVATATLFNGSVTLATLGVTHFDSTLTNMDYQSASLPFIAQGSTTILQFQAFTTGSNNNAEGGVVIDAVTVVPEPTSLAMIGIGGGLAALLARKRRRPSVA